MIKKCDMDIEKGLGINRYDEYLELVKKAEKFSDLPVTNENPLRWKLQDKIRIQRVVKGSVNNLSNVDIVDRDTGEVMSGVEENRLFVKREIVDNDSFVKLYNNRLKEMFDLSHSAIKVFGYFLHLLQGNGSINKDMIYFDIKECMEFCGYKNHRMVYDGLTELAVNGFIARCNKNNHFYIDPSVAFNGNRIIIMEEYVRQDSDYFNGNGKKALK